VLVKYPKRLIAVTALLAMIVLVSQALAGQVPLAWNAPTTNTDGTLLTDLAGYKLYYWQPAWDLPGSVDVGNQTTYTLTGLTDGQTYSLAVTAYNTGRSESIYSNTVTATITASNRTPQATADAATTPEDTAVTIAVLANDTDPDGNPLTITAVTQGAHGTVTTNGTSVTYLPATNFAGTDAFSYTVSDGKGGTATAPASITIMPVNDWPVATADAAATAEDTPVTIAVLANDTDPDGNPLTITAVTQGAHGTIATNGTALTYTPAANFAGTDAFTYTVTDGQGGTATATVSLTVTPVNDAPLAAADTATTPKSTPVTIAVLANDRDPDGDPLTISVFTQGAHGTVTSNGSTLTYTPVKDYTGTDAFSYTVRDSKGSTASAAVSVTITNPDAVMLWLEGEKGLLQPAMQVGTDAGTPPVSYAWSPESTGDIWNAFQPGGFALYTVQVPTADTYVLWGRLHAPTAGPGSFFVALDVVPEELEVVSTIMPTTYTTASLHVGDPYYVDSAHTITALPATLADLVAIKTANADRNSKNLVLLTFTLNQDATLYVAYDAKATSFPTWLTSAYTNTGLLINTTNGPLAVWKKEVLAGTITIPGARYQGPNKVRGNYLVLLAPHGDSPYLLWELPASQTAASWVWDQAASDTAPVFFLEAGTHTLTVKQRESGTKLDKLLLTNDTDLVPQD
jgi:Bacterial Ig domain/Fibronectin type III domain